MTDLTRLNAAVAKFRKGSPNIAIAFDEVGRLFGAPPPTVPPTPPPAAGTARFSWPEFDSLLPPAELRRIAPVSAAYVDELVNQRLGVPHQFMVTKDGFSVPIYYAKPGDLRRDIMLVADWNKGKRLTNCPWNPAWKPSPGSDAHLCVIDTDGCEYNFWGWGWEGPLTAGSATTFKRGGKGFSTYGHACRAAGSALTGGVVLRSELETGVIPHALAFATQTVTRYPESVAPATDGYGSNPKTGIRIPLGARMDMDPTIAVTTANTPNRHDRSFLECLQDRGAFCVDGGGFGFYAEDELTAGKYPDWPLGGQRMLPAWAERHLRILEYGPPIPRTQRQYNGPETCLESRIVPA